MKRWLIAVALLCAIVPASAFWQSRDSNYNQSISGAVSCSFPTLPGLAGRWNALNVTILAGHIVTATELSGSGASALTPLGGSVPYNATGYNGHPAFDFIAANNALLAATSVPMGTSNTGYAFFVGQMKTNTASFGGAVVYGVGVVNDFNGAGSAAFFTRNSGANELAWSSAIYNPNHFAVSLATNYRVGVNFEGSGTGVASVYLNNVVQATPGLNSSFSNNGTIVVGGRYISGAPDPTNQPWEGPITEIVVGSGTLSASDLNNLDAYFTCQWGT